MLIIGGFVVLLNSEGAAEFLLDYSTGNQSDASEKREEFESGVHLQPCRSIESRSTFQESSTYTGSDRRLRSRSPDIRMWR